MVVTRFVLRSWYCALILAVAGGGAGTRPLPAQDLPAPTQNAVAGAKVFGEKGCIRCHSTDGTAAAVGPDLRLLESGRTFQDLTAALWNHLPEMSRLMTDLGVEPPRLSEREAGDLFAYLYTLGYFWTGGDPERGRRLFTEMNCIRCHQVGGVGGVVGPVLDYVGERGVPIEVAAAMWNHGPAMMEAARERGIPRPRMSGSQLSDLISFLQSFSSGTPDENLYLLPGDADAGIRILTEKSCVECHGRPGAGGAGAPDLAGLKRGASLIDFVARMWNKAPSMMRSLQARDLEFPQLQAQEFANIVAYLYSVNYFAEGGVESRGRALIAGKGCGGCHTADEFSSTPGLEHASSVAAALWNHLILLENEGADADWASFTGREMGDLMAFFQASSP